MNRTAAILLTLAACSKKDPPDPVAVDPLAAILDAMAMPNMGASPDAMKKGAREQFGKQFSCPDDRVDAKRRTDLEAPPVSTATPPDEVKADPGRLAKWQSDQAADQAARSRAADHLKFEVTGCGHTQLLDCRPHHGPNGAVYPDWADCREIKP